METVDKKCETTLVRVGIGPKEHEEALRLALGCEAVLSLEQIDVLKEHELPLFRDKDADIVVFIRPTYVTPAHLKWISTFGVMFEVAGHEPVKLRNWQERKDFMLLKPNVPGVVVPDGRGAKPQYEVSEEHLNEAIADWHAGAYVRGKWTTDFTLKQIEERMKLRTGRDIKYHWVRDKVNNLFGSAHRNPDDHPKKGKSK